MTALFGLWFLFRMTVLGWPSGLEPSKTPTSEDLNSASGRFVALEPLALRRDASGLVSPNHGSPRGVDPRPARLQGLAARPLMTQTSQGTPLPPGGSPSFESAGAAAHGGPSPTTPVSHITPASGSRWSAEFWIFLREGSGSFGLLGNAGPAYGGSQAGAILRYTLFPNSVLRPQAYVRAVGGLKIDQTDLAAGLSLKPVPSLPVTAHFELRATDQRDRREIRPAAFVAGGIDDIDLPVGAKARGYAQAGYIGGTQGTGFADASLVIERGLSEVDKSDLSAGLGAWGGAQRSARRLDIGPTAKLRLPLGAGAARLSADYRFRIAGDAAPDSGAAITLSAGF